MSKTDKEIKNGIENAIKGLLKVAEINGYDDYWFYEKCLSGDFLVESFFKEYFREKEGMCCCIDKAKYTVSIIKKMIKDKKIYELKETYREYQRKRWRHWKY